MKRRKRIDEIRNQGPIVALGQAWRVPTCLGQAGLRRKGGASPVSGVNAERGKPSPRYGRLLVEGPARGRTSSSRNCKGESTDARQGDGPPCSSEEPPVIGGERRGRVVLVRLVINQHKLGGVR